MFKLEQNKKVSSVRKGRVVKSERNNSYIFKKTKHHLDAINY